MGDGAPPAPARLGRADRPERPARCRDPPPGPGRRGAGRAAGRRGRAFVGLTPQGLARSWPERGGEIRPVRAPTAAARRPGRGALRRDRAQRERAGGVCRELIERAPGRRGARRASRRGRTPTELRPESGAMRLPVEPIERPRTTSAPATCYAAALFTGLAEGRGPRRRRRRWRIAAAALRMQGLGPAAIATAAEIEAASGAITRPCAPDQPARAPSIRPASSAHVQLLLAPAGSRGEQSGCRRRAPSRRARSRLRARLGDAAAQRPEEHLTGPVGAPDQADREAPRRAPSAR